MSSRQGGEMLTEIPEGDEWIAPNICATICKLVLPKSPNCPFLVALSLEGSKALMGVPSSWSLKELSRRYYKLFMELSPQVRQLYNLVLLDLDETQIADLPKEIGELSNLEILRLSLDGYMNCGKQLQGNVLIHPGTIKRLSQLMELKIGVNPDNEDWNAVEEVVVEEACSLERLELLMLYLPNHRQRLISRVPEKVEVHFQRWDKCLKFVKGNDISSEMKWVVGYQKAFYLERHATAKSLCDFGINNEKNLKFCLLEKCNKIQTIINERKSYEEEKIDIVEDKVNGCESGVEAYSAQEPIVLNLQYLHEKGSVGSIGMGRVRVEKSADYLHSIFSPIDKDDDVMIQMQEMYNSGSITNQGIVGQVISDEVIEAVLNLSLRTSLMVRTRADLPPPTSLPPTTTVDSPFQPLVAHLPSLPPPTSSSFNSTEQSSSTEQSHSSRTDLHLLSTTTISSPFQPFAAQLPCRPLNSSSFFTEQSSICCSPSSPSQWVETPSSSTEPSNSSSKTEQ
ncbi:hypothetical protein SLEP1_g12660 [Rubroshorea leprosula]|uniref:Uncharacterized protein n=1 Tax=Rubroshorea leprosula TaxID=152421 RepID=A0AAV5IMP4_9ROSI|nr:hypothetical protein SLEP1_g12660 [Rubroshorea leprosula]